MTWPRGDFFVKYYKEHGDFYSRDLYTRPQIVVDSNEHAELNSISLEDL